MLDEDTAHQRLAWMAFPYLTQYLTYRPHSVELVLCGHVHEEGGKLVEEMGIRVSNAANSGRIVGLET